MRVSLVVLAGVAAATALEDTYFAKLLKRQQPGTPQYDCHAACGGVISASRTENFCDSASFKSAFDSCMDCAQVYNIWQYYGTSVSRAATTCGLAIELTPAPASSSSATAAASTTTAEAQSASSSSSASSTADAVTTASSESASSSSSATIASSSTTSTEPSAASTTIASGNSTSPTTSSPAAQFTGAATKSTVEGVVVMLCVGLASFALS
ncbi:hypothetical protein CAC42_3351 [Sphaceloma murrayae]|uniref:Uncharacterized protein n=1 Tax=Sphaceloma murrayae TaxID=2082308 RepID=A0A2K1R132_9PEZI|nr:hypothetical protein CAC42_3351 [Sphaceloma murrayae]